MVKLFLMCTIRRLLFTALLGERCTISQEMGAGASTEPQGHESQGVGGIQRPGVKTTMGSDGMKGWCCFGPHKADGVRIKRKSHKQLVSHACTCRAARNCSDQHNHVIASPYTSISLPLSLPLFIVQSFHSTPLHLII